MRSGRGDPEAEDAKVEKDPFRVSFTGLCLPKEW
jgi:hypothetical protein